MKVVEASPIMAVPASSLATLQAPRIRLRHAGLRPSFLLNKKKKGDEEKEIHLFILFIEYKPKNNIKKNKERKQQEAKPSVLSAPMHPTVAESSSSRASGSGELS